MTQAAAFRALHAGPDPLILANAWDAGSARLIASLGARAIATSSAAVAWSHGYADGHA
ncbi:isocitrate lyase/phosphoenolpyruvate mutase family protein, partial [Escherichia coli]|uniref:isocitrate lyase/phosphoenolpyruvate mutase family protein n=2 Tax=Pseudomonadota TaxID=1224 RepID=UPI001954E66D